MQEALDNIVLMPTISHISNLSCSETDEKWIKRSDLSLLLEENIKMLEDSDNIKIDYLELRNKKNLQKSNQKNKSRLFIAYYLDKVRLIDNF